MPILNHGPDSQLGLEAGQESALVEVADSALDFERGVESMDWLITQLPAGSLMMDFRIAIHISPLFS